SGVPGAWTSVFSEAWNNSISLTGLIFEIKAGTWQAEANAAGTVTFDNFRAAVPAPAAPAPTVSAIAPSSGPASGGTTVTLTGSGFQPGAAVTFGGSAAEGNTVNSGTSISAPPAPHAAGVVDVVVTNPDSQNGALTGGFTYTAPAPAPTVSSVSPGSGPGSGGTAVTIAGTGFSAGATV